jgi:hypothetical protein
MVYPQRHGDLPAGRGAVEGEVLDQNGHPLSGIRVYADRQGPGGILPVTRTDKRGKFFLPLEPGDYSVYAVREVMGYRDVSHELASNDSVVKRTTVSEGRRTGNLVIRLNTEMPRLLGRPVDAETSRPVANATILVCAEGGRKQCVGAGTTLPDHLFRLLLPPMSFNIKVSAPGYQDWYYGKDGSKEHAENLQLRPNTEKQLLIQLHKSSR